MCKTMCLVVLCLVLVADYAMSCCVPDKVQGTIGLTAGVMNNGVGSVIQGHYNFSYDSVNQRTYLEGASSTNGFDMKLQLYQDLKNKKQYIITGGKCIHQTLEFDFDTEDAFKCFPADKKVYSSYIGSGSDKINVDVYQLNIAGMSITISVTSDTCTLLGEQVITDQGVFNIGFMGMKSNVEDVGVFEVPALCNRTFNYRRASQDYNDALKFFLSLHK